MNFLAPWLCLSLCVPAAPTPAAPKREFTILTIDGRTLTSSHLRLAPDGKLVLDSADIALDDLSRIAPSPPVSPASQSATPPGAVEIFLADGGRLWGRILDRDSADRGVRVDAGLREPLALPFEALAGIRFAEPSEDGAEQEFQARLARRDAARDFLIAVGANGVTALPGALEELTPDAWAFRLGGQLRRGALARTYAIVVAAGTWKPDAPPAWVTLRDGGVLAGSVAAADDADLSLKTSFGMELKLPWSSIQRLDLRSRRVAFLSDLRPARVESRGFFGRSWPWRADAGLYGGPLRIGPESFARGLAVHSHCELVYELTDAFTELRAAIGIDDSVQENGNVVFRVRGDDRTLFDSGAVKAGDPPREIVVPLPGVRRLTLEVDFGDGLDLGDWAVWGQARLIR